MDFEKERNINIINLQCNCDSTFLGTRHKGLSWKILFFLLYFVTLVRGVLTDNSRSIPLDSQKTHSYINFLFSISPIEEMAIWDAEHDEQEDEEEEECPRGEVHDGGGEADGDAAQVRHHAHLQRPGWTGISWELLPDILWFQCCSASKVNLE